MRSRLQIWNERLRSLVQVLAETLVVGKHKRSIFLNWPARGCAKLVALKRRRGALVEEVRGIQRVVAQKFVHRAVPLVASRLRREDHLAARMFAQFGAVRISLHVELAHRVDAKKHPARSTRL